MSLEESWLAGPVPRSVCRGAEMCAAPHGPEHGSRSNWSNRGKGSGTSRERERNKSIRVSVTVACFGPKGEGSKVQPRLRRPQMPRQGLSVQARPDRPGRTGPAGPARPGVPRARPRKS